MIFYAYYVFFSIMRDLEIVNKICEFYGHDINEILELLDLQCNVDNKKCMQETPSATIEKKEDITPKPFNGIVNPNCCKAVVYNHGLYTQCTKQTSNTFCSSNCKKLKYGRIEHRKNFPVGTYVLENGKKEISYQKVKKRLEKKTPLEKIQNRIITTDSDDEVPRTRELEIYKNPRGRPKMPAKEVYVNIDTAECIDSSDEDSNIEEILVRRQQICGKEYLVSENNIVFDNKSYKMIGRILLGKLVEI